MKRLAEAPFAERLPQLKRGHPRVFRDETPQAGITHRIPQVTHVDVCLAITLARKGEYRVRAGLGAAVDQPREVHTQKWELRIGHRINQVAHQPFAALDQLIVLATERNDSRLAFLAGQPGDTVAMQPGAVHEVPADELTLGRRRDPLVTALLEPRNASAGLHVAAVGRDAALEFAANCRIVDDSLLRHTQRSDATDVRLALEHCLAPKKLDAFKSVLPAALLEFAQSLQLSVVARHNQFTADLVSDAGLAAKLDHLPHTAHGEDGLGRSRLVIEAAVQYAAVVATLVAANFRFLFQ